MFFGKSKQTRPSAEQMSAVNASTNDDWHYVPSPDPSFEVIDSVIEDGGSENPPIVENKIDIPTSPTQREQLLETMEELARNNHGRIIPHEKWTTKGIVCLILCSFIAKEAALYGSMGGGDNASKAKAQVPVVVVMEEEEDLIPFPAYDAFIAVPRAVEPAAMPDVSHFEAMKSHELQQQQQPAVDYAAFVAAQIGNASPPKQTEPSSLNPRPSKPSAVPVSKIEGSMKSRKRRSVILSATNDTAIPSVQVGVPRPPEQHPEHDDDGDNDMIRSLKRRIEDLEAHNEVLLEKFVRTSMQASNWKSQAVACDQNLAAVKEDRDALAETIEVAKRLLPLSNHDSLDSLNRNSKKPMASMAVTEEQQVNTTVTVSRRRDLRSSAPVPTQRSDSLSLPGPTALIPSPA